MINSKDFANTVQMEQAILEIRRYQVAYIQANNVKGIMVKWKKGWYAVYSHSGVSFYRSGQFRDMTDVLERHLPKRR